MILRRRKSKVVKIGKVAIGGGNPIAIQSMVKCATSDIRGAVKQIKELQRLGCAIVRVAVKDISDARAIAKIKPKIKIPLVADIHFDRRLALEAIACGADKIRLNPGNIYRRQDVIEITQAAKRRRIALRVGLNSGSLPGGSSGSKRPAESMVKSALAYLKIIESCNFYDIVISLKASNILDTIEAYRLISRRCNYPLHLGITASGPFLEGIVKSSIGIGYLLLEGIGDTIRTSLTEPPQTEVETAKNILASLGLGVFGPEVISCPTCGRCEVDLVKLVNDFKNKLNQSGRRINPNLKVALMGCVVNGPGEAAAADMGVAFGKRSGLYFKKGKAVKKVSFSKCISVLLKEMGG